MHVDRNRFLLPADRISVTDAGDLRCSLIKTRDISVRDVSKISCWKRLENKKSERERERKFLVARDKLASLLTNEWDDGAGGKSLREDGKN